MYRYIRGADGPASMNAMMPNRQQQHHVTKPMETYYCGHHSVPRDEAREHDVTGVRLDMRDEHVTSLLLSRDHDHALLLLLLGRGRRRGWCSVAGRRRIARTHRIAVRRSCIRLIARRWWSRVLRRASCYRRIRSLGGSGSRLFVVEFRGGLPGIVVSVEQRGLSVRHGGRRGEFRVARWSIFRTRG